MKIFPLYYRQSLALPIDDSLVIFIFTVSFKRYYPGLVQNPDTSKAPERSYGSLMIRYQMQAILGIPMAWLSKVCHYDESKRVIYQQHIDPVTFWRHNAKMLINLESIMFKVLLISFGFAVFLITATFLLARTSQAASHHPIIQGRLRACPDSPNCNIVAIAITDQKTDAAWHALQQAITEQGGELLEIQPHYLWATFKTPFFGFIDDVEAGLNLADNTILLRSASRIGHYDFGVNKKRLNQIKVKMQLNLNPNMLNNIHE